MPSPYADPEAYARKRIGLTLNNRWTILDVIDVGGAAWVYRASSGHGLPVAVKVLHQSLVSTSARSRFVREAKIANGIQHAGVVHVLDDGAIDGRTPFLVMEYLDGETLHTRAVRKGGMLPLKEVMWAVDEVLDVLTVAHKRGIVHRDIKPENIFLTAERRIKLLDFGVARAGDTSNSAQGTKVGTLLGTIDFMPPEQARGEIDKVGVQTDLWAVGATMFTLLSGRTVHDEVLLRDQIRAVTSRPAPPLRSVAPHVPESIAMLVDYALRFDAGERWANARAMRTALVAAHAASGDDGAHSNRDSDDRPRVLRPPETPPLSLRRPRR